jgi:FkbM family methyltransferase
MSGARPLARPLRAAGRALLETWGRLGKAPGWRYEAVERWGPLLGESSLRRRLVNGCTVACDLKDHVERHIYFHGLYEPVECWVALQLMRPGMVMLDVGANVGQYAMLASTAVEYAGVVYAFEPAPQTFRRLQRNLAANALTNVRPFDWALSDAPGEVRLGLPAGSGAGNAGQFTMGAGGSPDAITCRAEALDARADELGLARVDFVKMDIEGAELRALTGMRRILERDRPILLVEVNREALGRAGTSPEVLWSLLCRDLGYRAWVLGSTLDACGAAADFSAIGQSNVVLHHDDLPDAVTGGWDLKTVLRWARG